MDCVCDRALLEVCKGFFRPEDEAVDPRRKYTPPPAFKAIEVIYVDQSEVEGYGVRAAPFSISILCRLS